MKQQINEPMKQQIIETTDRFKHLISFLVAVLLVVCLQTTVYAASSSPGTVLTVDTSLSPISGVDDGEKDYEVGEPIEPAWVWHPISVVNETINGFNAVRRTYSLPADVNPAVISTADFEMFGQRFSFAYVLQRATADESYMELREVVTIEARSRNLADVLPLLEQEIWFERDGFEGTLILDIHSITSEVAGTTRSTSTATRQRTFPHLAMMDNSFIPRTITEGNTTFHLYGVDWETNSISSIDGHPVASSYTAHATYTAQITQTRTTGYRITAEYVGMVFRTTPGETLFTAIFYGEPLIQEPPEEPTPPPVIAPVLPTPAPTPEPEPPAQGYAPSNSSGVAGTLFTILGVIIGLGVLGAGGYFAFKHFTGYNVTVYSINGPREIVKAGRIKLDANDPEPVIMLDKTVERTPAETDRYIIQITQKAVEQLVGKNIRVTLYDKEAQHEVPEKAVDTPVYEFEVNFADDDPYDENEDLFGDDDLDS